MGNLKKQLEVNKLLLDDQLPLFENQESSIMLNENINFSRKKYILPSEGSVRLGFDEMEELMAPSSRLSYATEQPCSITRGEERACDAYGHQRYGYRSS